MSKNAGFTLIELVAVMLILAILAVVAVPEFVDLSEDAEEAAVAGVAGGLSSASTLNYATEAANGGGTAVANCTDASALLATPLPAGYVITPAAVVAGVSATCTLTGPGGEVATFVAIGV